MLSSPVNSFTCRQKGLQAFRHAVLAQVIRTVGQEREKISTNFEVRVSSLPYVPPVVKLPIPFNSEKSILNCAIT
jgi:hypothetical protein